MIVSFYSTQLLWQKLSFGLLMFGFFLWLAASTSAAPGDLDTSFGDGGKVVTLVTEGGIDEPTRVRIQPDGKIVTVGVNFNNGFYAPESFLVRHNADGTVDNSFGTNGSVIVIGPLDETFQDFVILPDGKFLVTGYKLSSTFLVVLYRYTANGTLDATFGTNGVITTPVDGLSGRRIVLQPDGKFVVACRNYSGSEGTAVVRYNPNGTLDATFGTSGVTTLSGFQNIGEILVQTDGKLLVAGDTGSGSNRNIFVLRYNPNGTLDNSFGANGIVQTDVDNQSNAVLGMALQSDGKIIVNGENRNSGNIVVSSSIVRYNANGTLDSSFGTNGIVRITEPSQSYTSGIAITLAIQQNGKILTAGGRNGTFAISRYNSDGTIDASFGTNGVVITPIGNYPEYDAISSIALQTNGKIVAVGSVKSFAMGLGTNVGLVRYLGDSLNTPRTRFDFDGDGKTDISIFRPSVGEWWVNRSLSGQTVAAQFGAGTDKITPADFTGDGKTDIAFWRPSTGEWFILRSEDGSFFSFPFGTSGDIPAPFDYDGDGRDDPAVFRAAAATWYISLTSGGTSIVQFGADGDVPVVADYDGDGKSDIAIFRPSVGEWWYRRSSDGQVGALQFGSSTDKPVPGDYTGDGRADIAFFRPDTGFWFILRSEDNSFFSFPFGANGDIPAPGDYDGDGKFDTAVFRPATATWYINRTTAGILITTFGTNEDIPVPSVFVP